MGEGRRTYRERPVARPVWELALDRCRLIYDRFDTVAVMFSGGKDSTATLHAALEVAHETGRLPLRAIFLDEECIPRETEDYVRRVAGRPDVTLEWYCLPVKHRNACSTRSPWWFPWAPEAEELWARPLPAEALRELAGFPTEPPSARPQPNRINGLFFPPARDGNACVLFGVRAEESLVRRQGVLRRRQENYLTGKFCPPNVMKGYPIYDWRRADVWTAAAVFGWDYNRAYDVMEAVGIPPVNQRCSPAFGEEPLGQLHMWPVAFPDLWERMVARVPGAGAAVRYARTELYGFGARPEKPAGMLWSEFLSRQLDRYEPVDAAAVAAVIASMIRRHYERTAEPIVEKTGHPASGVSWDLLLRMAMRGSMKNRAKASVTAGARGRQEREARLYPVELAAIRAAGRLGEMR